MALTIFGDRQAVVQKRHHELAIVAQDGRLARVEGIRLRPAKAEAKTEIAGLGGGVVRPGIFGNIQPGMPMAPAGRMISIA